ncbi:hypothetical protein [Candidatus Parabeggiatoa sp. HSG14]|uniref:hypothetical protein n=1 Tax=Candidatus Parabeggiatoa sp. HSG14 TaxID=3055593 RepID=UPI0025A6F562|nr:hypothetical protein [Thiotrichales bacterium HSG14]
MAIEKKPTLTLGLRKKSQKNQSQEENESQTTNGTPKITLGLKKKTVYYSPNKEELQAAADRRTKLALGKKQEFIKPEIMTKPQRIAIPNRNVLKMPTTKGKLEINIKISELPNWVETIKHGFYRIYVSAEGQVVRMKVRPKTWNKLLKANEEYPMWIASITGKMGLRIKNGFELLEPAIQVYERKAAIPKNTEVE